MQAPKARALPFAPIRQHRLVNGWPPVWWVGCHGGAGATTLAAVTGLGADVGGAWPVAPPGWPPAQVVLVCRATALGVLAATAAVEQWRRGAAPPGTRVLGVVVVAASARRPPRRALERVRLLAGWVPALWRVRWVEEYLAADNPRDLGVPPEVAAMRHHLSTQLAPERGPGLVTRAAPSQHPQPTTKPTEANRRTERIPQ
ncbi:hypothetical protein [Dactylosporangium sp. CA-092794]|uniref:hypothetical protein n=1 Tax=Dactylosporangium sp. CA-092794 TaxID=3239929 RepID=UPI003D945F17